MVDESWWQGVQLEVAHAVRTDHHRGVLFVEGIHHLLERLGRGVEVVGVELHGKASAAVVVDGLVPAAADTEVGALGDDVDEPLVVDGIKQLGGLVRGVVVHHDDIIFEVCLLREGRVDGIADGLLAVVDGDDDRCLDVELLFVEVRPTVVRGIDLCADLRQVGGGGMFHLYLHLAVAGVHVVELLHARGTGVGLLFRVELLVDMEQLSVATQEEAQGIETGVLIVGLACLHGKGVEQRGLHQQQRTEVEVVADAARLVVDDGVGRALAVDQVVAVGIHHRRVAVGGHAEDTLQGVLTQLHSHRLRLQQHVVGLRVLGNGHQGVAAREVVDGQLLTAFQRLDAFCGLRARCQ